MGGVSTDSGGKGGRRSLDSEINMIPMIDLLMVTISFLLITAVWSHMARVNANAQVPGPPRPNEEIEKVPPEKQLHVEMRTPDKFQLIWKEGATVVETIDVPRKDDVKEVGAAKAKVVNYPDLAAKIEEQWKLKGSHRDLADVKLDQAVLHTDNETPFVFMIAVVDAIYQPKRMMKVSEGGKDKNEERPAFNVTFSVN
jgi:biopolymer transport protein ExbD